MAIARLQRIPQKTVLSRLQLPLDLDNLYITMQMPDKTLITGKHGMEFWNEDSMEFYVNASGDLNATSYGLKMMQVNINASDIGNTDPNALTITGSFQL